MQDHIGFLVNLGEQFGLWSEPSPLADPRSLVTLELINENLRSVAWRYGLDQYKVVGEVF